MFQKISTLIISITLLLLGCGNGTESPLPVLGPFERTADGEKAFYTVRDFRLLNQEGDTIGQEALAGKIRVADFFFTSCPTICPQLQSEMIRIREAFAQNKDVVLLSYTIDPKRDSVAHLAKYALNLGVEDAQQWHFLTGNRDSIYTLADDYFNIAVEDPSAPGGFDHSGRITVVDPAGQIRSIANGLNRQEGDQLIKDIKTLIDEINANNTAG